MNTLIRKLNTCLSLISQKGFLKTFRTFTDIYFFDWENGIETRRALFKEQLDGLNINSTYYAPVYPSTFSQAMKVLPEAVRRGGFVDYGSGKGRALILAAKYGFKSVAGVEISNRMYLQSLRNIRETPYENIKVFLKDACDFPIPLDSTVFFMYNPFNDVVLRRVLRKIIDHLDLVEECFLIYVGPLNEDSLNVSCIKNIYHSNESQTLRVYKLLKKKESAVIQFSKKSK